MSNFILIKIINIYLIFFACLNVYCQQPDKILWTEKQKLTWDDFLGSSANESKTSATTSSGISYTPIIKADSLTLLVECYFEKKESFVKPECLTAHILNHEQKHFDMTEIFARKLRKSFLEYKFNRRTLKVDLTNMFNKILDELDTKQDLYDAETWHSKEKEEQLRWDKKIQNELKSLEKYSDSKIKTTMKIEQVVVED